ncbi:MAG: sporulation protein YunB [Clostridia bacterium]|nr:sporulation protein YunB [Clostridia bacterium]
MKLFGQTYIRRSFALFLIALTLALIIGIVMLKRITPSIKVACESKAKSVALGVTNETVKEILKEAEHESLVKITYNTEGKIVGINADVVEMNRLSSEIAYRIQEKLSNLDDVTVKIPLAKLIGLNIFSGYGPKLKLKLVPYGNTLAEFNTEFASEGINQTRHTIYIDIASTVNVIIPLNIGAVTSITRVTVAETVIVGDIPETYYNIEGIKDAAEAGILDSM